MPHEISKIVTRLLLNEPFFGHYLAGLPKEMSEATETAGVGLFGHHLLVKLSVNPDFWASLSEPHRYGLLKHEVLHLVFRHLTVARDFPNQQLFNIAADLAVNQYIPAAQLPAGGVTLSQFAYLENRHGIKLEQRQDAGYYYFLLDRFLKGSEKRNAAGADEDLLNDLLTSGNAALRRHNEWRDIRKMSPGERKILEQQADTALRNALQRSQKSVGSLPAGMHAKIKVLLPSENTSIDWRRILRLFAAGSNASYLKNTLRRPSKRYGTTPGIKVKRRHKLLVGLDTSGSVSRADLQTFFAEIYAVSRRGAEITIAECDSALQRIYPYRGEVPAEVKGRGGTDFTPVIRYANEELKPDAVIYFTDGFAPPPQVSSRFPLLWVITAGGATEDSKFVKSLPGRLVRMQAE